MKYLFVLMMLVVFACSKDDVNEQPVLTQLLLNSNMELGGTQPQNWYDYGSGPVSDFVVNWTSQDFYSASKSLMIARTVSDPTNFWDWGQVYEGSMSPGKDLLLSIQVKGVNLSGQGVSLVIRGDGADGKVVANQYVTTQGHIDIKGTFGWTKHAVRLNSLSSNVKKIYVFLVYLPGTTGEVYFDDATLMVI
jgi:hypothetical protein